MKDIPQTCNECPFLSETNNVALCDLSPANTIDPEIISEKRADRCIFNYTAIVSVLNINIRPMTLWDRVYNEQRVEVDWRTKGRDKQ